MEIFDYYFFNCIISFKLNGSIRRSKKIIIMHAIIRAIVMKIVTKLEMLINDEKKETND